ncbi:hypothetical protein OC845_003386 [Tilletia horrida]|nr:hypothetical protein OC845_003386 [Tilletia horrida]
MTAVSLLDLPASLLIDSVFSHLGPHDLTQLALVSRHARALVDNDLIWARRLAADFHFPLNSSARPLSSSSSTQSWWKTIYARLSNPHAFVWGQATFERLGIDFSSFPQPIFDLARRCGGVPFPIPLPTISPARKIGSLIRNSSLKVGPPVSLHAGGWSFHALTASGHVIIWGVLNGEVYVGWRSHFVAGRHHTTSSQHEQQQQEPDINQEERSLHRLTHPGTSMPEPTILPIPPALRLTQLSTGRKHAVALSKVRDVTEGDVQNAQALGSSTIIAAARHQQVDLAHAVLLEWHAWGDILRVDLGSLFGDNLPSASSPSDEIRTRTNIVQVEAGWEYSAVLSHRHEQVLSKGGLARQTGKQRTLSEVHFWLTGWSQSARRRAPVSGRQGRRLGRSDDQEQNARQSACATLATISPITVQLPPLPPPPPGLLSSIEREREHLQSTQRDGNHTGLFGTGSSSLDQYYAAARRAGSSAAARIAQRAEAEEAEQLIVQIAAGSSFLLALTDKGLVYRMDILRGRRIDMDLDQIAEMFRNGGPTPAAGEEAGEEVEMDEEQRRTNAEAYAYRQAMDAAWRRGDDPAEGWELLEPFCVPSQIARCGPFVGSSEGRAAEGDAEQRQREERLDQAGETEKEQDDSANLAGYVDASVQITHISAHFRDFAAYAVGSTSRLGQASSSSTTTASSGGGKGSAKSIVLLGNEESTMFPEGRERRLPRRRPDEEAPATQGEEAPLLFEPNIIPELQARSIIKVVHGDWHAGALDASGQVVSWGEWSDGALGIYDSFRDPSPASTRVNQADQFREALAQRIPWAATYLRPSPQEQEQDQPGQDATEGTDMGSEARLKRRAARKDVRTRDRYPPTKVLFDDYREEEARPKFVFDLAMSGWQSGALAVDYDGEVNLASDGGAASTSQRSNMTKSGIPALGCSSTPAVRMQAHQSTQNTGTHRPALSLDPNAAREPTSGSEEAASPAPEWRARAAFAQSPTSTTYGTFPALFGGGLSGLHQRGTPTRIIAHGHGRDTDVASQTSDAALASAMPSRFSSSSLSRPSRPSLRDADQLEAAGRRAFFVSVAGTALAIFSLFGGWERIFLTREEGSDERGGDDDPVFMRWPFNLAYFVPLLVPLTLYIVIARWTGEKLFRHS